jgi:predicted enzyme related to lactoylglutathione lyase
MEFINLKQKNRKGLMNKLLLLGIFVIPTFAIGQSKSILAMDFVGIENNKRAEALFFYENNWKVYRDIAIERGLIKSYSMVTTPSDTTADFDLILLTEYSDSLQFKSSEENFQKIIKETRPNGPKLLNDIKPIGFRENLFFKEARVLFSSDRNVSSSPKSENMKKVTGIGGIFFKCKDPNKMKEWYKTHLGLDTDEYGTNFEWRQGADANLYGFTQWSPFSEKTKYFEPSKKEFMINYRVENLEALVEQFKKDGVTITDKIESFEYGKFVHILDMEGNKIELWEPNDVEYNKIVKGRTK